MTRRIAHLLRGAASLVDVFGAGPAQSRLSRIRAQPSELEALRGDWRRIGGDLGRALDRAAHEQGKAAR